MDIDSIKMLCYVPIVTKQARVALNSSPVYVDLLLATYRFNFLSVAPVPPLSLPVCTHCRFMRRQLCGGCKLELV